MTERTYRTGDVVAWPEVPEGALAKGDKHPRDGSLYLRRQGREIYVGANRLWENGPWPEYFIHGGGAIIALAVPADATADDLRMLAEVFEVREAMLRNPSLALCVFYGIDDTKTQNVARRLHRSGWRPGMTAEDAARLLAEAQ